MVTIAKIYPIIHLRHEHFIILKHFIICSCFSVRGMLVFVVFLSILAVVSQKIRFEF